MKHKPEKFNIIPNALSRLPMKRKSTLNNLKLDFEDILNNSKNNSKNVNFFENDLLFQISNEFKVKLMNEYAEEKSWKDIIIMLKDLNLRFVKKKIVEKNDDSKNISTDINFKLKNDFVYYIKNNRLCILFNCEKDIFEKTHDKNAHVDHHRIYEKLIKTMFIFKMSRKLRQYIKYCSACELNQIKKHVVYEQLVFISTFVLSFKKIVINFIFVLSEEYNTILTIFDKTIRRKTLIPEHDIITTEKWNDKIFERLMIADWKIPENIIFDKNKKWMFKFWKNIFKRLNIKLLISTSYYSQTDDLFERINQIVEIVLRFLITKNSKINIVEILSILQISLNNSIISFTGKSAIELMYGFKVQNVISCISIKFGQVLNNSKKMNVFADIKLEYVRKAAKATSFANFKAKIYYDVKHKFLLLESNDKIYIRLHHEYKLPDDINKKLKNQRCGPFSMMRKIKRLAYKMQISIRWKIHSIIFITQLKPAKSEQNFYNRYRFHHFDNVKVQKNIFTNKFWKVEKIVKKKTTTLNDKEVVKYQMKWLKYESKFDEWRNIDKLTNCLKLIEEFEVKKTKKKSKNRSKKKRPSKKSDKCITYKAFYVNEKLWLQLCYGWLGTRPSHESGLTWLGQTGWEYSDRLG